MLASPPPQCLTCISIIFVIINVAIIVAINVVIIIAVIVAILIVINDHDDANLSRLPALRLSSSRFDDNERFSPTSRAT